MSLSRWMLVLVLIPLVASSSSLAIGEEVSILGAWKAESYDLKTGTSHSLDGLIFFTENDWATLFFTLDADKKPRRGSGEAGTYVLEGEHLTFSHQYHMSAGEELGSLPAAPLSMEIKHADPTIEPCRFEIKGDEMVIFFPSDNQIRFNRSSR